MSRKAALAAVWIATILGVAILGWNRLGPRANHSEHSSRSEPEERPAASEAVLESAPSGEANARESVSEDAPQTREESDDAVRDASSTIELHGTVVVLDEHGVEHASEDGSMWLWAGEDRTVEVHAGRWKAQLSGEFKYFSIRRVVLSKRTTVAESIGRMAIAVPKDRFLQLRVLWPPAAVLRVQAEESRQELDRIDVVHRPRNGSAAQQHPGDYTRADVVVSNATSPIVLDLDRVERHPLDGPWQDYYVRSPGRAWTRVVVDFVSGGEKTVLLKPGAALEVVLTGVDPPKRTSLFVREKESSRSPEEFRRPLANLGTIVIPSLLAGAHVVSVESGDGGGADVLASAKIVLEPGQRSSLPLELRASAPEPKVLFEGIILIPAEWNLKEPIVLGTELVEPDAGSDRWAHLMLDEMQRQPGTPGVWAFSFPAIRPGRTHLHVRPLEWVIPVQVGERGSRDVQVEVPRPGDVHLRVLEADSDRNASIDTIRWDVVTDQGAETSAEQYAKAGLIPGSFEFRVPSGELRVRIRDTDYEERTEVFQVEPGRNDLTVSLSKACGFFLRVQDGTLTKSFDAGCVTASRPKEGRWTNVQDQLSRKRFTVTGPGRYRLTIRDFEGYQRIPAREIDIKAGEFVDLVIDLVRKP